MNKWQIICPVATMALVAIVLLLSQGRRHERAYVVAHTIMIGQELVRTTNSARLTGVDPALRSHLAGFLGIPGGVTDALAGDQPRPAGDGTACSRLILTNAAGGRLGIRLGRAAEPERFEVLGFWTGAEANGQQGRRIDR